MSINYIELTVQATEEKSEILVALLSDLGFESFVEEGDNLMAYIREDQYQPEMLQGFANLDPSPTVRQIPAQNWNHTWEANFEPILIRDSLYIRASHHPSRTGGQPSLLELVIEPKMSFGTGHHATTSSMCELMLEADLKGRSVIDAGSGTGILAILAEKLGATDVFAFDHEEWAVENARENATINGCKKVRVELQDLTRITALPEAGFVLANITRNMILDNMDLLTVPLAKGGEFFCSGFLAGDLEMVEEAANRRGLNLLAKREQKNWCAARFIKTGQ